jgi:small-conductance mechanosensitive channel
MANFMFNRPKKTRELRLERMFETRSDAWERVGLAMEGTDRAAKKARRQAAIILPLLGAVLVVFALRHHIFGFDANSSWETAARVVTVILLLALGWALARDIGRAVAPIFFRRMDPSTAGTVGFLIRLVTMAIAVVAALAIADVNPAAIVAGSAFTAIILGLAAQQTLGNLFAGMVLISARPFRVGERIKLQAGAVGGTVEGVVSSLGLLYTTLARGADRILIPNTVVLAAVVVPIKEPEPVDVRVRLSSGVRPTQVQAILDQEITTPTRGGKPAVVLLEEVDGDEVVFRVQATPEHPADGPRLADQVFSALSSVTSQHEAVGDQVVSRQGHRAPRSPRGAAGSRRQSM